MISLLSKGLSRVFSSTTVRKHLFFSRSYQILTNWRNLLAKELVLSVTNFFVVVQSLSHVHLFAIPCTAAHRASLSFTISWSLLRLMSIESVMPSNHLILCHPLLFLPSIFPSIRVFSSELALHIRWPKYGNFSFSVSPSNEYSELISCRTDWFDLLAVHGNLNSLQHHSSKTSVLRAQPSLWSNTHIWTWLWKNHSFDCMDLCGQSNVSTF